MYRLVYYSNTTCSDVWQLSMVAGVPVSGISNDDVKEVKLQLFANTSRSYALRAGGNYYVPVRIAKSANENTCLGIYNPQYTTYLGPTNNTPLNFTNKLHSSGFGVIVSRQEKVLCLGNNNIEAVKSFWICHNEWNPEVGSMTSKNLKSTLTQIPIPGKTTG
ncbi:hypothetical protein O181_000034 [Austropuccinia psidii MF-1]|uniref:Uncharacterized protein n=1 Tax=Austropuccinia psidii MF-1 TaxID=1389203 RepID=A0A9Q3B7W6_9BASI|nr:hypothetical protein [Austropuccinia psidii MF-1]